MINAIQIGLSGLLAATTRLENVARNTANAQSSGSLPGQGGAAAGNPVYQPVQTGQTSLPGGGAVAYTRPLVPGYVASYEPDSPDANAAGMVAQPDVDPVREAVDRISARQSFLANLKTIETASAMAGALFKIKV